MTKKVPKKKPRGGVDEYGRTPLHDAARDGNSERIEQLVAAGADPNAQDDNAWSALHFAAQANSAPAVKALVAAGARIDVRDSYGNTPLWKAVFASRGDGGVIKLLREEGADPCAVNNHGVSPVSLARTIANFDVGQFFVDLPEGEPREPT